MIDFVNWVSQRPELMYNTALDSSTQKLNQNTTRSKHVSTVRLKLFDFMFHKMTATKKIAINIWKYKDSTFQETKQKPNQAQWLTRKDILKCNDTTGMSKVVFL